MKITLEQLIAELLLHHNCVIIPTFGGFVAKQTSAKIDFENGSIHPPSKSLLFNRQLINSDGLLTAQFAHKNGISYSESEKSIDQLVNSWRNILNSGQRISIDTVGFLFFDQERNICFEQDRFFNLLLASFGLEKVHFLSHEDVNIAQSIVFTKSIEGVENNLGLSILPDVAQKTNVENHGDLKVVQHPRVQNSNWKRYIAAACFLPLAFYTYWLPVQTKFLESGIISIKDFNPFYQIKDGEYRQNQLKVSSQFENIVTLEQQLSDLENDVEVFPYKYDDFLYIPIRIKESEKLKIDQSEIKEIPIVEFSGEFDLIVGCFQTLENAKNLVLILKSKNFQAYVMDQINNSFRVSAGNVNTNQEAMALKTDLKNHNIDAWILKN